MQIGKLDHVNLRTSQLQAMIDWYGRVLQMHPGPRPDFNFPGAWLYAGDGAAVHLVGRDGPPGVGAEAELKLEHFAFSASGRKEFEARLKELGEPYRELPVPSIGVLQFNVWDPDGNHIHIDFQDEDDASD